MNDIERAIEWLTCERENYSTDGVYHHFMGLAVKALEKQLNGGWIPVSERLPEEYGCYLIAWRPIGLTDKDILKNTGTVPHYYEIVEYDPDDEALWLSSIESCDSYEILAWQRLPEPYKEVKDEN